LQGIVNIVYLEGTHRRTLRHRQEKYEKGRLDGNFTGALQNSEETIFIIRYISKTLSRSIGYISPRKELRFQRGPVLEEKGRGQA